MKIRTSPEESSEDLPITISDALVLVTMGVLTAILVLFPFLPYLNCLPYYLGVHRLIWREYYRDVCNVHDARMVEGLSPGPAS